MLAEEKRDMSGTDHTGATSSTNNLTSSVPQGRAGGAPARIYMNERIVPYLLEGMKAVAKDQ
jgi:COMPASS component SDC1